MQALQQRCASLQVVAEFRGDQRGVRQQQAESREVERCMERMLSQVAAKEHSINYEVRAVSPIPEFNIQAPTFFASFAWLQAHCNACRAQGCNRAQHACSLHVCTLCDHKAHAHLMVLFWTTDHCQWVQDTSL